VTVAPIPRGGSHQCDQEAGDCDCDLDPLLDGRFLGFRAVFYDFSAKWRAVHRPKSALEMVPNRLLLSHFRIRRFVSAGPPLHMVPLHSVSPGNQNSGCPWNNRNCDPESSVVAREAVVESVSVHLCEGVVSLLETPFATHLHVLVSQT
jgi:hypothetical protein